MRHSETNWMNKQLRKFNWIRTRSLQDPEYNNQEQTYQGQSYQDKSYNDQHVPNTLTKHICMNNMLNQDPTNQQPIQEYTHQEYCNVELPTQEKILNNASQSEDHGHIKIGDFAAFMGKGEI